MAANPSMTGCFLPSDQIFSRDKSVFDWEGESIRKDVAISDYHRAPLAFQLRRSRSRTTCPETHLGSLRPSARGTGNYSRLFIAIPD